jgi:uncharacterized membrane protein (DUF2068 family)
MAQLHDPSSNMHSTHHLKIIAAFEVFKAILAMIAGLGLISVLHRDVQAVALELEQALHLDLHRPFAVLLIQKVDSLNSNQLLAMLGLVLCYATIRLIEALGLWFDTAWAKWIAVISGLMYLPIELYELTQSVTLIKVVVTVLNIAVVLYIARDLKQHQDFRKEQDLEHLGEGQTQSVSSSLRSQS